MNLTLSFSRTHSLQDGGPFFQLNLALPLSEGPASFGSTGAMMLTR
jgi:hypothetical protein